MKLDLNPDLDSVAQVRFLVAALEEWLQDQPDSPATGTAQFVYRADGSLDSVLTSEVVEK